MRAERWMSRVIGESFTTVTSQATLLLPDADRSTVRGPGGLEMLQVGSRVRVVLLSGTYVFSYPPTRVHALRHSIRTSVADLLANPETRAVLAETLPRMIAYQEDGNIHENSESLFELFTGSEAFFIRMSFGDADLDVLDAKLADVPARIRTA